MNTLIFICFHRKSSLIIFLLFLFILKTNMNYLAHLFLSGDSDEVKVGNFIGDHVKGKQYLSYPQDVQTGILLHRQIDSFTDNHPLVKECSDLLRPVYRKYSGIITDLFFDHFLANMWNDYSEDQLRHFTRHVHAVLLRNYFVLPPKVRQFLPFLIQNKRLQSYAEIDGITKAIEIMGNYTSLPPESQYAKLVLQENYNFIKENFIAFFREIIQFTEENFGISLQKANK